MFPLMIITMLLYIALVVYFAKQATTQIERLLDARIQLVNVELQQMAERKNTLLQEKTSLQNRTIEIFTLYDVTKEITKTLHEDVAFQILEQKLKEHVKFEHCRLIRPQEGEEMRDFKKGPNCFVFTLKEKRKKLGHLIVEGVSPEDHEKLMILGHQFTLALRRVELYEEIEKIALTDSLTDLHTRRYALQRLEEEISRAKARKIHLSLLMIDVDYFKKLNDTYGHLTGDQVLREIGAIIKRNTREIDISGRYGGEEFCIVLPDTDARGAQFAAERIRKAAEDAIIKVYDEAIQINLSIGVATFPDAGKDKSELIDKADWALYRAKKQGRNRVCVYGIHEF